MAMKDNAAAGKMGMRDYAAGGKDLMISSTTFRQGVQEEYQKLQRIVREAKVILMDLEWLYLQDEMDYAVWHWLKIIRNIYYKADDMLDELSYEATMRIIQMEEEEEEEIQKYNCMINRKVCNIINSSSLLLFRGRMSCKIKNFQHVLDKMKMEFPDIDYSHEVEINEIGGGPELINTGDIDYAFQQVYNRRDEVVVVGSREEDKTRIVNIILNQRQMLISVLPILGLENVGKKTLAKLVFDDESIKSHFDLRFWVYMSYKRFDVKRIVTEIVEQSPLRRRRRSFMGSGGGDLTTNWDNLQHMLEEILGGKTFLLVLSDMTRDKERWNNLKTLLKFGSKGSTIIVTTEYKEVATIVGTIPPYELSGLSIEESWALFRKNVFGRGSAVLETPNLVKIGLKLVEECHGFPLALTILGAMMRFKTNIQEWTTLLSTMKALLIKKNIVTASALKICYNDMESPLKRCFTYCSVFPENFIIEKKKLIQLWLVQGFLEQEASSSSLSINNNVGGDHDDVILMEEEDIGNAYFKSLVLRSFLRVVEFDDNGEPLECTMDAPLRYFAQYRVQSVWPRTSLDNKGELPSLLDFKSLRVLELIHVNKDELPSSIGELIHLRHLDLSHGRFKALPASISKLYHLQTLKLLHCRFLQRLPKGMTKLINLRHLEIEKRLNILKGIGKLHHLRTLTSFKVGNINVTDDEAGIEELGCLKELEGSLSIIGLSNVKNGEYAKAANLKEKAKLQELTLDWDLDWHVHTDEDVLQKLQPHPNLFVLRILRFNGTNLPTWLTNGSLHLSRLQELCIYSCHHVTSLDLTGLSSLRKLKIAKCETLEYAGVEGLMHLELLEFEGCDKLKSLVANGANQEEHQVDSSRDEQVHNVTNLRSLAKLQIKSCNHLTTLPKKLLQSLKMLHIENYVYPMVWMKGIEELSLLQHLQIENCSNLEELPKGIGLLTYLQHFAIIGCPKLMFLSEEMQHWTLLRTLSVVSCANLRALPCGIGELTSLQELEINGCDNLASLPDKIQELKSLQKLKIERCSYLMDLPDGLKYLSSLKEFEISSCNSLRSLPGEMLRLTSLEKLKIEGCDNMKMLRDELGNPSSLCVLAIIGCPKLQTLPKGLGKLQNLRILEIAACSNLMSLPSVLGELSSLGYLYIQRCLNLTYFPDTLPQMTSLRVLWLIECPKLKDFSSGLRSLSALEKLTIWGCHKLIKLFPGEDFLGIQALNSLQELIISNCSKLQTLPYGLENLPSLKVLVIWKCPELKSFENVVTQLKARKLRKLNIRDCPYLETIDDAS